MNASLDRRLVTLLVVASALALLLAAGCNRDADSEQEVYTPDQGVAADGTGAAAAAGSAEPQPLVGLPDDAAGDEAEAPEDAEAGEAGDEAADEDGEAEDGDEDAGDDQGDQPPAEDGGDEADDPPAENGGEEPADPAEDEEQPAEPPAEDEPHVNPDIDAAALYQTAQCGFCHGDDLKGARQGPPLTGLDRYWDTSSLAQFLLDPAVYAQSDRRLIELGRQYNLVMGGSRLNDEQRTALAAWLLKQ